MSRKAYRPYGGRRKRKLLLSAVVALFLVGLLCFAMLTCVIAAWDRDLIQGEPQIMIVLGCKVQPWGEPSTLLKDRLDEALAYLKDHPEMTVVVSGGKGNDEPRAEADVMYDYLVEHGVSEGNLLKEDSSFSTWENLENSFEVLAKNGYDVTDCILVVSNGFHLSRVHLLWSRLAGTRDNLSTLAAPTSHEPSRWKMFFREPVGLVKSFLLDW